MKAYFLEQYWKTASLHLQECEIPSISEDEVLVKIKATSINPLDNKIKHGDLKLILPYKTPFILGHDMSGVLVQVGKEVRGFEVWDEVFARVPDFHIWTFAEYVIVKPSYLTKKPKNLSFEEAASLPLVSLTVLQVFEKANLQAGQKVFIQAGSGGVGMLAIQLAKLLWAFVATTTSTKNIELVKQLWADVVIDYTKEKFENLISDYDLVLHSQDKETLKKSMSILKKWGKIISLSEPPTSEFAKEKWLPWYLQVAMYLLSRSTKKLAKSYGIDYHFLFMKADGKQLEKIAHYAESGHIKVIIDKIFDFSELNQALEYSETGRAKGKIVVKISE